MPLSLDAIEQVVNEARRMGFTVEQLNGIRAQLLIRSAQPDGATKLDMALAQMPRERRQASREFLAAMAEQGQALMARGRGVLEALSDEDWAEIVGPEDDGA